MRNLIKRLWDWLWTRKCEDCAKDECEACNGKGRVRRGL